MTRTAMLSHLQKIGTITVESAVAEGFAVLIKHENGEKLSVGDRIAAGIVWYEFLAEDFSDVALTAAVNTQEWLRAQLNLNNDAMFREEQRMGELARRR